MMTSQSCRILDAHFLFGLCLHSAAVGVLSTPIELLEWGCQGLPSDAVSVENGLIATRGLRWPLMIDPQDQANRCASVLSAT